MLARTSTTYPPMVQYLRTRRGRISCGEGFFEVTCLPGACSDTGEAGKEARTCVAAQKNGQSGILGEGQFPVSR